MAISAGVAFIEILGDFSAFAKSIDAGLRKAQPKLTQVGKNMTKFVTLPILAAGAASVKMAVDFEKSMTQIQALAGQSRGQVSEWSKEIIALAPKVGRGPQELAEALYFVASSGVDVSKAMEIVEISAKAAAAGLGDTQTIADLTTSAMNAYATSGLTAAEAVDTLTEAVKLGKGEAADFAPVLGQVLPTSSELGVSFSDVSAALAAMTTTGIDAAEGATRLRAIFSSLLKVTPAQAKAFTEAGLSADDLRTSLAEKGLLPTLQDIKTATGDNVEALAAMFPNVRALQGVLALVGQNGANVARIFQDMGDSTGALDEAFKVTTQSSAFKMQQALANLQAAGIKFGEILIPIVEKVVSVFSDFFAFLGDMSPAASGFIVSIAGVAAALGPLILLLGNMPRIIDTVKTAFGYLTGALSNPVLLAITGIVVAVYAFSRAFGAAEAEAREFTKAMVQVSHTFVEQLGRMTDAVGAAEAAFRVKLRAFTKELYDTFGPEAGNKIFKAFIKAGPDALAKALKDSPEDLKKVQEAVRLSVQATAQGFRNNQLTAEQAILGFEALGRTAEFTRDRMIKLAGATSELDLTEFIDAMAEAQLTSKGLDSELVEIADNMAAQGKVSSTEYADALLKLGFSHDAIKARIEDFNTTLSDTANNLTVTGKQIHVFTFQTQKDFNEWSVQTQDDFAQFVLGNTKMKQAFNLTTKKFKQNLEEQARIARQGAEDLKVITNLPIPEDFLKFLIDQGPAAIHAFVEGSKPEREAMKKSWKDIDEATGKYNKTLDGLAGIVVENTVKADTKPARDSINKLMNDLKAQGFTLNPNGSGFTFGGQLRHGGGAAGSGKFVSRMLKGDEVASILQRGEFVVQRDVAQRPGMLRFLELLNSGKLGMGSEFHSGGVVQARANMIQMQGLLQAMANLQYAYNRPPDITMRVGAKLPTADELIEKLIGSVTGGGAGLSPNAARYAAVIRTVFGNLPMGTIARRNIAGTSTWSQHAYGNAVDVMTGASTTLRKSVADFSNIHRSLLSIAHLLADPWYRSPRGDHYNHVHADFNPQGSGTPPPGGGWIGAAHGYTGKLDTDTWIRAHSGEFVDIIPKDKVQQVLSETTSAAFDEMNPARVARMIQQVLYKLGSAFSDFASGVESEFGKDLPKAYRESLKELTKTVNEKIKQFTKLAEAAKQTYDDVIAASEEFHDGIVGGFSDFQDIIGAALSAIAAAAEPGGGLLDLSGLLQDQIKNAQEFADQLLKLQSLGLSRELLAQIAAGGASSQPLIEQLLGNPELIQQFNNAFGTISDIANQTADDLTTANFGAEIEEAANALNALNERINNFTKRVGNQVERFIQNLQAEKLGKHVETLVQAIRHALNQLGVSVPKMASGGIVTRPTLVMAGEAGREAIIPLDKAHLAGPTGPMQIFGTLDTPFGPANVRGVVRQELASQAAYQERMGRARKHSI